MINNHTYIVVGNKTKSKLREKIDFENFIDASSDLSYTMSTDIKNII